MMEILNLLLTFCVVFVGGYYCCIASLVLLLYTSSRGDVQWYRIPELDIDAHTKLRREY